MITQFKLQYNSPSMSGSPIQTINHQTDHSQHSKANNNGHKNSSVRVICRIKPLSEFEEPIDMKIDKDRAEISIPQPRQETTKTFTFNRIFTDETQGEFVSQTCKSILHQATIKKQGYLVFSYGVTNSGKTHTILGSQSSPGILPYLVQKLSERGQVYLSAIQLYNDEFFSLTNKEKLTPREQNGFLDFEQCGISQPINFLNMDHKFKQYINNRTQNDTKMNSKSSRSHAIFRIQTGDVVIGVVDLAGSQRAKSVMAILDETSNINKSLLCLGKCIKALNQNPDSQQPIPYRQSKLTKVLIQYFAAKVEVLMIANINQSQSCFHQNMKVLDYAVLAKDIRHCTTQNSLKKSSFKFAKSHKVDVFEALYKSAAKSAQAHKSLKSSRSKLKDQLAKSHVKQTNANENFAKALKSQQLQVYIQKFQSSQQTFDYMVEYMHQKELEQDQRRLNHIKKSHYQSPFQPTKREIEEKVVVEIGVGRQQKSIQLLKKQVAETMKLQLKKLLQQQRLAKMESKETCIGDSLQKISQKSHQQSFPKQDNSVSCTPKKQKLSHQEDSFIVKTSSAIYSSVKKILSKNVHSMKKIIPKFMKGSYKNDKLAIYNYSQLYHQLFKFDSCEEQRSQFSFYGKISKIDRPSESLNKNLQKQTADFCTQTDNIEADLWKKYDTQDTRIESDFDSDSHPNQICSNLSQVIVQHSQASVSSSEDKDNVQINQTDQQDSQDDVSKQTKQKRVMPTKNQIKKVQNKARRGRKANKTKSKVNQGAQRVAQMRKMAARLCRQQSRTPLKKRLRNHRNQ